MPHIKRGTIWFKSLRTAIRHSWQVSSITFTHCQMWDSNIQPAWEILDNKKRVFKEIGLSQDWKENGLNYFHACPVFYQFFLRDIKCKNTCWIHCAAHAIHACMTSQSVHHKITPDTAYQILEEKRMNFTFSWNDDDCQSMVMIPSKCHLILTSMTIRCLCL